MFASWKMEYTFLLINKHDSGMWYRAKYILYFILLPKKFILANLF